MSPLKVCVEIRRFRRTRRAMGRAIRMAGASVLEEPQCTVFRGASELGRPGASKGSAFAFLGMFPAHVYAFVAMLLQMVVNANQERSRQLHLTYGRFGQYPGKVLNLFTN